MAEEPGGRAAVQPVPVAEILPAEAGAETPKTTTSASRRAGSRGCTPGM